MPWAQHEAVQFRKADVYYWVQSIADPNIHRVSLLPLDHIPSPIDLNEKTVHGLGR